MKNNTKYINKLVFSKLILVFLILTSLIVSIVKPSKNIQNINFKYYTVNDNEISDSIDSSFIKTINEVNNNFIKEYPYDALNISIYPKSNYDNEFVLEISSSNPIESSVTSEIYENYKSFLINSSDNIFHVSHLSNNDTSYSFNSLNYIIWGLLSALILSLIFLLFIKKVNIPYDKNKFLSKYISLIYLILLTLSVIFNFTVLISALLLTSIVFAHYFKKFNRDKALSINLCIGLGVRVLVFIAISVVSFLKFGTLLSYLQPDEIFYYSTANEIGNILYSFNLPDYTSIVGLDQFGYNAFIGFIRCLNGSGSFFTIKIINICFSIILIPLIYDLAYEITSNNKIARVSSLLMSIMPTFALFSSFALRDVLISFVMVLIFLQVVKLCNFNNSNKLTSFSILVLSCLSLWYLRRFALIIMVGICLFYSILKIASNFKINIWISLLVMIIIGFILLKFASSIYNFNITKMILNYFNSMGYFNTTVGVLLSMINLDFILNASGSIYSSIKLIILRLMYPETLFLIASFPIFIVGIYSLFKKYSEFVVTTILLLFGLVLIYRIEYGGWFLRTQLQILPFQYILVSAGTLALVNRFTFLQKVKNISILKYYF